VKLPEKRKHFARHGRKITRREIARMAKEITKPLTAKIIREMGEILIKIGKKFTINNSFWGHT
jgi:hypothetical protein